ncbi:MAG TPA: hypothetical protein VMS08_03420 [Candidatus Saccharimonadia bacterium]|nr:hypothetical protein [Candidatus Saccharimonadia bacterium]
MSDNLIIPYNTTIQEAVCELYAQGMSLAKIGEMPDMPSAARMYGWCTKNKEFREALDAARYARALALEDKIVDLSTDIGKDDVPAARLEFDKLSLLARVNNPARYGNKTTVEGNPDKPLTFVILTGVPEPKVESKIAETVVEAVVQEQLTSEGIPEDLPHDRTD